MSEHCPTCGQGVRVVGSEEGTMHYEQEKPRWFVVGRRQGGRQYVEGELERGESVRLIEAEPVERELERLRARDGKSWEERALRLAQEHEDMSREREEILDLLERVPVTADNDAEDCPPDCPGCEAERERDDLLRKHGRLKEGDTQ